MPTIRITTRNARSSAQADAFCTDLSARVSAALGTPDNENWIVQQSAAPGHFFTADSSDADYAVVTIEMVPGRSIEKKRALYATIAEAFEAHGTPGQNVRIVALEVPPENWGIYGGQAASDVFRKT